MNDITTSDQTAVFVISDNCEGFDCLQSGTDDEQNSKINTSLPLRITVSPNPVSSRLTIDVGEKVERLEVLSGDGSRVIHRLNTISAKDRAINVDVSDYYPGLYLVRAYSQNSFQIVKFIKQ